jgi:hypothetical protein
VGIQTGRKIKKYCILVMNLFGKIMYGTTDISNSSDCAAVKLDALVLLQLFLNVLPGLI